MTYVANEPGKVDAWVDQTGMLYSNRDDAIAANFTYDFRMKCVEIMRSDVKFSAMPVLMTADFVRTFIEQNPEIVRVMLGDRDAV